MEQILERVKDEICGKFIVVTSSSDDSQKLSSEDLLEIFTHLLEHTFVYCNGCIYIQIWEVFMHQSSKVAVLTRTHEKRQNTYF